MLVGFVSVILVTLLMLLVALVVRRQIRARFGVDDEAMPMQPATPPAATDFKPPQRPIEMRLATDQITGNLSWVIGLSALPIFLFTADAGSWQRWLAWPAALIAIPLAAWSLWDAINEHGARVVADARGVQQHDRGGTKSVQWSRVARIRHVEHWADDNPNEVGGRRSVRRRQLVFSDARGNDVLTLLLPLRPAEANAAFLASLPVWTGHPIETERR